MSMGCGVVSGSGSEEVSSNAQRKGACRACTGFSCTRKGGPALHAAIEDLCGTALQLHRSNCMGLCRSGPNLVIQWDDEPKKQLLKRSNFDTALAIATRAHPSSAIDAGPIRRKYEALRAVSISPKSAVQQLPGVISEELVPAACLTLRVAFGQATLGCADAEHPFAEPLEELAKDSTHAESFRAALEGLAAYSEEQLATAGLAVRAELLARLGRFSEAQGTWNSAYELSNASHYELRRTITSRLAELDDMPLAQLGGTAAAAAPAEHSDGWELFELSCHVETAVGGLVTLTMRRCGGQRHVSVDVGAVWHLELEKQLSDGQSVVRAYTPLSSAEEWEDGEVQLLIRPYADGLLSGPLCQMEPSETVRMRVVPTPSVQLPQQPVQLALCAAGTGVMPMLQILDHVLGQPAQSATLLYCTGSTALHRTVAERLLECAIVGTGRVRIVVFSGSPSPVGDWGALFTVLQQRMTPAEVHGYLSEMSHAVLCGGERFCTDVSLWLENEAGLGADSVDVMASTTR